MSRRAAKATRDLLSAEGYEANSHFNAVNAMARLLFYDLDNERQVDVFVGTFEMCHKLPLEPRLTGPGPALSPAKEWLPSNGESGEMAQKSHEHQSLQQNVVVPFLRCRSISIFV